MKYMRASIIYLQRTITIVLLVILVMGFSLWTAGCSSATKITIEPDPSTLQTSFLTKCDTIAIQKNETGLVVREFFNELRDSKLFDKVYYPQKADERADLVLKPIFGVEYDKNAFLNIAIGMVPFNWNPWRHYDYEFTGQLEVYERGSKVDILKASVRARISVKHKSMDQIPVLQPEAYRRGKKALYRKLIIEIEKYRKNRK